MLFINKEKQPSQPDQLNSDREGEEEASLINHKLAYSSSSLCSKSYSQPRPDRNRQLPKLLIYHKLGSQS